MANLTALEKANQILGKNSANDQVNLSSDDLVESMPHISTGSLVIDNLIGGRLNTHGNPICPGIPKGRIINLYGHESSGKTTLALSACTEVYKRGGTVAYIDFEHAISPLYAEKLGVPILDPKHFTLIQPETLEDGMKYIWVYTMAGVDLIVVDSVGACVSQREMEKKVNEQGSIAQVGGIARMWSQFLPKIKAKMSKSGTAMIAIAQIRDNISTMGYGDSTTVQGGKAWKFYSAIRIKLQRMKQEKSMVYDPISHKKVKQTTANQIKCKLEKNKIGATQNHEAFFYIQQGEGIDNIRSLIDTGIAHKVIKKGGAWITWNVNGEDKKAQGFDNFKQMILMDNLVEELQQSVMPHIRSAMETMADLGDNTGAEEEDDFNMEELKSILGADGVSADKD
jgi:recombination protein RecA